MICTQCKVNQVTMIGASVCSLKCACDAIGDDYAAVKIRLTNAIALSKIPCKRGTKAKVI